MGEISIKINIADRVYPLRVESAEEEVIRHAAKLINEKVLKPAKVAEKDCLFLI